jgi:hypothetical protein
MLQPLPILVIEKIYTLFLKPSDLVHLMAANKTLYMTSQDSHVQYCINKHRTKLFLEKAIAKKLGFHYDMRIHGAIVVLPLSNGSAYKIIQGSGTYAMYCHKMTESGKLDSHFFTQLS